MAFSAALLVLAFTAGSSLALPALTKMLGDLVQGTLNDLETGSDDACSQAILALRRAEKDGSTWALRVMDSFGVPSTGVMQGGVSSLGYFSECVNTRFQNATLLIENQYCLTKISVRPDYHPAYQNLTTAVLNLLRKNPAQIALCMPQSCLRQRILNSMLRASKYSALQIKIESCSTGNNSFFSDIPALVTASVFGLIIVMAAVGTLYEGLCKKMDLPTCPSLCYPSKRGSSSEVLFENQNEVSLDIYVPKLEVADKESFISKFLCCFSFLSNGRKILNTDNCTSNITVLNGIRFFSMAWIILGHSYSFGLQWLTFRNPIEMIEAPKNLLTQAFSNGTFSVDTFFFLCGILVAMNGCNVLMKTKGKMSVVKFYLHRYIRLTPVMMAVIAFCAFILRHVANGPKWLSTIESYDVWCRKNWWTNLIYMQNFIHREQMCLSHTWYSAVDFQIYLVSPILLFAFYRGPKFYAPVWLIFFVGTTLVTAFLTFHFQLPAVPYFNNITPQHVLNDYFAMIYIKPYCRIGPFLVGMALGYYFTKHKKMVLTTKKVAWLWLFCILGLLTVLFAMYPANQGSVPSDGLAALYSSLARSSWALCLAWIVLACVSGYGGFINTLLTWPALVPLSRLTYCAYLIHPVIMSTFYGSRENVIDFSSYFMIYIVIGNLVLTYIASFFLSLLVESPIIRLEKLLLG